MKNFCLTIAGADPTSGAGIQADLRTFDRIGVHPFSVITALTYQTATEFQGFTSLSDMLYAQLDVIFNAYPIKFVKIGMIPDMKALDVIKEFIVKQDLVAVYDPISISSAGERLSSEGLELEIERDLFPHVTVLTPNLSEARFFSHKPISNVSLENIDELNEAAEIILNKMYGNSEDFHKEKAIILKSAGETEDLVFDFALINKKVDEEYGRVFHIYKKKKRDFTGNVHGTGCVFSSAITAYLSLGYDIGDAIELAENFFDEQFSRFLVFPKYGKIMDLGVSEDKRNVINQVKEIYLYFSNSAEFSMLIPEVRTNISGSLHNATKKEEIAGIEGRITIINGYPHAAGEIKFGASDHTARLLLSAKKFDNSINFVMNLKYSPEWISLIENKTDLRLQEISREKQPEAIKKIEDSTMHWLIKESIENYGKLPDIIWDKGSLGKEPIMRLFSLDANDMIQKLEKIANAIFREV